MKKVDVVICVREPITQKIWLSRFRTDEQLNFNINYIIDDNHFIVNELRLNIDQQLRPIPNAQT